MEIGDVANVSVKVGKLDISLNVYDMYMTFYVLLLDIPAGNEPTASQHFAQNQSV